MWQFLELGTIMRVRIFAAVLLCFSLGCPIVVEPGGGNPADYDAMNDLPAETPIVTVHFRNLTLADAVNVEFYLVNEPLALVPDDLFSEDYARRAQIGVAGTGIIEPLTEDVVTFECGPDLVLGTTGGTFLDNESGDHRGVGSVRWVQQSALGVCGHMVFFDYQAIGDAEFETVVRIAD